MTAPVHPQAALLRTLLEHVTRFPYLAAVNIGSGGKMQISDRSESGVESANSVLVWAKTLTDPRITIDNVPASDGGSWTDVSAHGSIGGIPVTVWNSDRHDLHRWVDPKVFQAPLEIERLAAYVAAGSTEAVIP